MSGSAADLAGHLLDPSPPTPVGITRDFMPLLPAPTFSTLGSLTLSHRNSGVSPDPGQNSSCHSPWRDAHSLLKWLLHSGWALPGTGFHVGQGLGSLSPSQESHLCLGQGAFLPWWAVSASSIHGSVLSLCSTVSQSISFAPGLQWGLGSPDRLYLISGHSHGGL